MSKFGFKKAIKSQSKLRLALIGPSGSGKTYTALVVASGLGQRVAVIDTEHGSASKYADLFGFDVLELDSFHPQTYCEAIAAAEEAGYDCLVIDSLSHAWAGKDGALEQVDKAQARMRSPNSFTAWRDVTPMQQKLVDSMVQSKMHIVATIRSKMDYVQDKDERGKTIIRKVGMAPVQRDGLEYEFDLVGDIDVDHRLVVTKSRIPALADAVILKPDTRLAETLLQWLNSGKAPTPVLRQPEQQPAAPAPAGEEVVPLSGEQFTEIKNLIEYFGKPVVQQTVFDLFKKDSLKHLVRAQGERLIEHLRERMAIEQEGEAIAELEVPA